MNQNDQIEKIFEELNGSFDLDQPRTGHRERFLNRLEEPVEKRGRTGNSWWRHLSIAASIALLLSASVFLFRTEPSMEDQVAQISPEVSQTSRYFSGLVSQQVLELQQMASPETQPLIEDALKQIQQLELNYQKLENDLISGGNSKMILSAMIQNFQTRIDLLQEVMDHVEQVKQLKNENHENTIA